MTTYDEDGFDIDGYNYSFYDIYGYNQFGFNNNEIHRNGTIYGDDDFDFYGNNCRFGSCRRYRNGDWQC